MAYQQKFCDIFPCKKKESALMLKRQYFHEWDKPTEQPLQAL